MDGLLAKYGPGSSQLCFVQAPYSGFTRHLVLVGGLTDGLLALTYAKQLGEAAAKHGFALVQAQLSSSYNGYGVASLDEDAAELHLLSVWLEQCLDCQGFVLMGHSTGCQDAVRFAQRHGNGGRPGQGPRLLGLVLQAPVSDREYLSMHTTDLVPGKTLDQLTQEAQDMVKEGRGGEVLFRAYALGGAPVCAARWVALAARGGDDDMFSSDFSADELQERLGHLAPWPCLVLASGADDSVPPALLPGVPAMAQRLAAAAGPLAQAHVIEGASHACVGSEATVAALVAGFLSGL